MELVYLWVENYKNIRNQGFNFSPRFECEFKDGILTIYDNKDYMSIFPDNINVTAIVGENGSGKSSIFEILSKILTLNHNLESFNYFYILNDGKENLCYSNNINILNSDVTVEKNISNTTVNVKLSHGSMCHKIALENHFDMNYLNISHLKREGIIKNDFIVSSHSPFILSDLPKENVIFLKKDEQRNCKNVTKEIELKTFGANIHTLLSNGFFMSDGLMGEFAKGKINEIKDFYDENKELKKEDSNFQIKKERFEKNKKHFRNIQKIIGEPFLQTIIKNYLDELEILFNGKKEFLDSEIKRLEELRNELK